MKIINILLAIMFLFFALLQINDPDPVVWILIYGVMVLVCGMAVYQNYSRRLMLIQAVVYVVYAITLWPSMMVWFRSEDLSLVFDDLAKMQFPYIEESREFLGLIICLAVLGLYWIKSARKPARHP